MREWLKIRRKEMGFTMKELGARLGISESYYCAIENGGRKEQLSLTMIASLAEILEVPVEIVLEHEMERIKQVSASPAQ